MADEHPLQGNPPLETDLPGESTTPPDEEPPMTPPDEG